MVLSTKSAIDFAFVGVQFLRFLYFYYFLVYCAVQAADIWHKSQFVVQLCGPAGVLFCGLSYRKEQFGGSYTKKKRLLSTKAKGVF